jgi:hypothetical protein
MAEQLNPIYSIEYMNNTEIHKILKNTLKLLVKKLDTIFNDISFDYYLTDDKIEIFINYNTEIINENNDLSIKKVIITVVDNYHFMLVQPVNFNDNYIFVRKFFIDPKPHLYIKDIVNYIYDIL